MSNNFQQMNQKELLDYLKTHREDDEAWNIYLTRLEDDPTVIRIPPNLDEAAWLEVEQTIKDRVKQDKSDF